MKARSKGEEKMKRRSNGKTKGKWQGKRTKVLERHQKKNKEQKEI